MRLSTTARILIVDGDPAFSRRLAKLSSARFQWEAVGSASIRKAIGKAIQGGRPYTAVFLDVPEPAPNLARKIRSILGLDSEIQVVLRTDKTEACRRKIIDRLPGGERVFTVRPSLDHRSLLQFTDALTQSWSSRREMAHQIHDLMATVAAQARAIGQEHEARRQSEEQLRHDALHDPLTGLANRALLLDRIAQCSQRSKRESDYSFAVLFVDVDRFQTINDSLGHGAGDQLLVEIALKITTSVRALDTVARIEADRVARLSGDEFALLLEPVRSATDAVRVAERLLTALEGPFRIGEHEVYTTARIGIALGNDRCHRPDNLLHEAIAALHDAKADDKSRVRIYNPEMHHRAIKRLSLEGELRQAIERDELLLWYQPIHSLATGRLMELESLVRWRHPKNGLLPPAEFIPLAEETGLIIPLGNWVLRRACRRHRQWQLDIPGMAEVSIGVNVSGRQFARTEFIAQVGAVLEETQLEARSLCLEITESTIIETGAPAMKVLEALHKLGMRLHLDDFGTGYSSLGYLRQLPIDVLKIDRSFINGICTGNGNTGRSIVQAIIALAHSLNMRVIAEGVESALQGSLLIELGCDAAQGFHFSRPLPEADVADYSRHCVDQTKPNLAG